MLCAFKGVSNWAWFIKLENSKCSEDTSEQSTWGPLLLILVMYWIDWTWMFSVELMLCQGNLLHHACTGGKDKKTQACVSNTFMRIWLLSYTASWRKTKLMGTKPCVSLQQVFTCTKITREFTSPTRRDTNTHKHIHIHILPYSSICQLRYYNRSTSTAY